MGASVASKAGRGSPQPAAREDPSQPSRSQEPGPAASSSGSSCSGDEDQYEGGDKSESNSPKSQKSQRQDSKKDLLDQYVAHTKSQANEIRFNERKRRGIMGSSFNSKNSRLSREENKQREAGGDNMLTPEVLKKQIGNNIESTNVSDPGRNGSRSRSAHTICTLTHQEREN